MFCALRFVTTKYHRLPSALWSNSYLFHPMTDIQQEQPSLKKRRFNNVLIGESRNDSSSCSSGSSGTSLAAETEDSTENGSRKESQTSTSLLHKRGSQTNPVPISDTSSDRQVATPPPAAAAATAAATPPRSPKTQRGVILRSGRIRLPDKLIEYLSNDVCPEVLYWHASGESFSFDSKTAQTELLDKFFNGSKLTSFVRSLNRWGLKRVFHALLPKTVLSYEHPLFRKDDPGLVKEMRMVHLDGPSRSPEQNSVAAPAVAPTEPLPPPADLSIPAAVPSNLGSAVLPLQGQPPAQAAATGAVSPSLIRRLVSLQQAMHTQTHRADGNSSTVASLLNMAGQQPSLQQTSHAHQLQIDPATLIHAFIQSQQNQQQNSLLQVLLNSQQTAPSVINHLQQQVQQQIHTLQAQSHQGNPNDFLQQAQMRLLLAQASPLNVTPPHFQQPVAAPPPLQQQQQTNHAALQSQIEALLRSAQPRSATTAAPPSVHQQQHQLQGNPDILQALIRAAEAAREQQR